MDLGAGGDHRGDRFPPAANTKDQLQQDGYLPVGVVEDADQRQQEPVDTEAEEACQALWEDVVAAQAAELDEIRAKESMPDWVSEAGEVNWAGDSAPTAAEEFDRLRAKYDTNC